MQCCLFEERSTSCGQKLCDHAAVELAPRAVIHTNDATSHNESNSLLMQGRRQDRVQVRVTVGKQGGSKGCKLHKTDLQDDAKHCKLHAPEVAVSSHWKCSRLQKPRCKGQDLPQRCGRQGGQSKWERPCSRGSVEGP